MGRTRVKICGVCRAEDAAAAARAGADAVGIVLYPNADRCVSTEQARAIVAAIPAFVVPVGLFVNSTAEEIRGVQSALGLGAVQLQGDESPEVVAMLKPVRVIKSLHLRAGDTVTTRLWRDAITQLELTNLVGILLETASAGPARGGTGVANDWNGLRAMQAAGAFDGLPAIIAAGGLTAGNVGDVVRLLRPSAVDVSSGVESGRREKSEEKIKAFVTAVREADEGRDRGDTARL
jgi:phosphoribosylanthranilate isomerase